MKLRNKHSGRSLTLSIEYNQIDSVLNAHPEPKDHTGHSVYPGNINSLIFNIPDYIQTLAKTKGQITEFINPKYKNKEKTEF